MTDNKKKVSAEEVNRVTPLLSSFSPGRNLKLNTDISAIMKSLKNQDSNKKRPKSGFVIQKPKKSVKNEPTASPVIKTEFKSEAGPSKPRHAPRKSKSLIQEEGSLYGQGFKVEPGVTRSSFSMQSSSPSTPGSRGSQKVSARVEKDEEEEEDFDWDDVLNKEYSDEDEEYLDQDNPIVLPQYPVGTKDPLEGFDKLRKIFDDKKIKKEREDVETEPDQAEANLEPADLMKPENRKPFLMLFPQSIPFKIPEDDKEETEHIFDKVQPGRIGKMVVRKSGKVEWHVGDLKFDTFGMDRMTRRRILVQRTKIDEENERMTQLAEIFDSMGISVDSESLWPPQRQQPTIELCDPKK